MTQKRKLGNAAVIEILKDAQEKLVTSSKQIEDFEGLYGDVMHPPYEPKDLLRIVEESSHLKQYVKAMATNIAKFGHAVKYKDDFDYNNADEALKTEADKEWSKIERLYKYINPTEDFKKVIEKMVIDRESIGWGTIEIMRDGKGEVSHIEYCRAVNMRICKEEKKPIEFKVLEKDETGEYFHNIYFKKFRKFAQMINGKKIYFKEFGDPRTLNCETGEYGEVSSDELVANEIAFFPIHDASTEYGVPRWTGSIADILGVRASEVLNFSYFESGTIIPAAIIVDGGQLTETSVEAIRSGKGVGNAFKLLLLETAPFEDEDDYPGESNKNRVSTRIESLSDISNKDSLFQEYQKATKEKIRDNFRLPPLFTGESTDYTRSTAETSREVAEEQIFMPEREDIVSVFNTIINNELGIKYVEIRLKGPDISDPVEKAKALDPYIRAGTVTPNMLIEPLEKLLDRQLEPLPDEIGNVPIEILKLQQLNKQFEQDKEDEEIEKSQGTVDILKSMMEDIRDYLGDESE